MKKKRKPDNYSITIIGLLLFSSFFIIDVIVSLKTGTLLTGNIHVIITKENNPGQFYSTVCIMGIIGSITLAGVIWLFLSELKNKKGKSNNSPSE